MDEFYIRPLLSIASLQLPHEKGIAQFLEAIAFKRPPPSFNGRVVIVRDGDIYLDAIRIANMYDTVDVLCNALRKHVCKKEEPNVIQSSDEADHVIHARDTQIERYVSNCRISNKWSCCITRSFASLMIVAIAMRVISTKHFVVDDATNDILQITGVTPTQATTIEDVRAMMSNFHFGTITISSSVKAAEQKKTAAILASKRNLLSNKWASYCRTIV